MSGVDTGREFVEEWAEAIAQGGNFPSKACKETAALLLALLARAEAAEVERDEALIRLDESRKIAAETFADASRACATARAAGMEDAAQYLETRASRLAHYGYEEKAESVREWAAAIRDAIHKTEGQSDGD